MKFFFIAEDSLYKIFKTLEKVPVGKNIEISIDPAHSLFDNEWRGKQIKEILDKRNIKAVFVTKTEKAKKFFDSINLQTKHIEKNKTLKVLKMLYLFAFDIKKFHLNTIKNRKNYIFFLVFGLEMLFVLGILYLLYFLVLPSAKIEISPSQQTETIIYNFRYYPHTDQDFPRYSRFISIPFYTGELTYNYKLSINTINVKYMQNPSYGSIKIINKSNKAYNFVPNTRFVTEDGRLFQSTNWIEIPEGYNGVPGEVIVKIKAMEKDENGILLGARGNIEKGTNLYVRNLKQSMFLKEVYAVAMEDFTGGSLNTDGTISQKDIDLLTEKLVSYITQQKKNIAQQNFNVKDAIPLIFDNTIDTVIKSINIPYQVGQQTAILDGEINISLKYFYVKWSDMIQAFSNHINQRPSDKTQLLSINKNTLSFFEEDGINEKDGTFIVPTKIEIIQGYDFKKDTLGIAEDIKLQIVGGDKEQARSYILTKPEISSVKIKISPVWYSTIPKLKSRINVNIQH